ncbi:MAG: pyridoxamine 5'-phosphate oxidase family protein [Aquimonas sp.]|nr:pyridoxamine 5'-phosphate oxidase family protein [Aquimonas sp.]
MANLPAPDQLESVLDQAWQQLALGASRRHSPFHQGVLASIGEAGVDARYVVLRGAERSSHTLAFHTDRRSPKCEQLLRHPQVAWCFFGDGVQLRCSGLAALLEAGDPLESAWDRTTSFGRRCYRVEQAPGSRLDGPDSGLPASALDPNEPAEAADSGRPNFARVEVTLQQIDWLHLGHAGHRRALFEAGDGWQGRWIQP